MSFRLLFIRLNSISSRCGFINWDVYIIIFLEQSWPRSTYRSPIATFTWLEAWCTFTLPHHRLSKERISILLRLRNCEMWFLVLGWAIIFWYLAFHIVTPLWVMQITYCHMWLHIRFTSYRLVSIHFWLLLRLKYLCSLSFNIIVMSIRLYFRQHIVLLVNNLYLIFLISLAIR